VGAVACAGGERIIEVIPGFEIKELFELIELGRILRGEVVRFGVIGGEIVEFPMVAFRCLR
jgi:hypothetical protein